MEARNLRFTRSCHCLKCYSWESSSNSDSGLFDKSVHRNDAENERGESGTATSVRKVGVSGLVRLICWCFVQLVLH